MSDLLKVRVTSFLWTAASILAGAVGVALLSPEFSSLVKEALKNSPALAGFVLLVIPEVVKHIRNLAEVKKLGSAEDKKVFLI